MANSKYYKLEKYLTDLKAPMLSLTFECIEEILNAKLPPSAYKYQALWANCISHPSPIARAWLNAGYYAEQLDLERKTVVFRKADPKASGIKPHEVCPNIPTMTADTATQLIRDYFNETVKDPHGRYMSWRHCYTAFSKNRNITDEKTMDYLALQLAFYLASWGMYRGSSFLLKKDYTVHIPVVMIIQEQRYNPLHGISAEELCKKCNLNLLNDIAIRIRKCYAEETSAFRGKVNHATDTLVTKILLGTLGCVPAFDRYFISSVKKNHVAKGTFNVSAVCSVARYYCNNFDIFEELRCELSKCGVEYPPMKLMDMCFWQDAYIEDLRQRQLLLRRT